MRKPVILYIEDSAFYQKMLRDSLPYGFDMEFADTCKAGLLEALKKLPDFIFLDVMLPDGLGTSLIAKIREFLPACFIVMVTSETSLRIVRESKESGANGYVIKPFSVEQINKYLTKWIDLFGDTSRPILNTKIISKIAELEENDPSEKDNFIASRSSELIGMDAPLLKTYPVVLFDVIDVLIESKGNIFVLIAWAFGFDGKIMTLGMWSEPKKEGSISKFLLRTAIKNLKKRGVGDVFFIESSIKIATDELKAGFEMARHVPFFLPEQGYISASSYEVLMHSLLENEYLAAKELLEKHNIDTLIKEELLAILEQTKVFFSFPIEARSLLLNLSWIAHLKEKLSQVFQVRNSFGSIEIFETFMMSWTRDYLRSNNDKDNPPNGLLSRKDYSRAMFFLSEIFPDRFPSKEKYVN